ncbi:histidine triad nucleotide-binding protein [Patescibacteria group bacterium]|nr:histidine triad nucleotide-binding protein [Patescibacteria group bacterium]
MEDCIFCKIIGKEIPSEFVYEDDEIVAFNDIHPKANHHVLIVPRKHIPTINDLNEDEKDEVLVGKMMLVARNIAKERGLSGYNLQFNVGESAGQIIFHIHLHLISNG